MKYIYCFQLAEKQLVIIASRQTEEECINLKLRKQFFNKLEDGMGAIIRDAQGLVIAVMTDELESEVCA